MVPLSKEVCRRCRGEYDSTCSLEGWREGSIQVRLGSGEIVGMTSDEHYWDVLRRVWCPKMFSMISTHEVPGKCPYETEHTVCQSC